MLEVRSLTKYYGALPALREASFVARPGQILGYLGPNGSGKSTTIRCLVGLMEPSSGDVLWKGKSIFNDLPAYRKQLGYVPEEPFLYTHLTAPEYLRLVGGLRGLADAVVNEKIDRFMRLFALEDDQYQTLAAFSKGMRQKVQLAAALLHNPELIVLDEPFSGLDVSTGLMLRSVIRPQCDSESAVSPGMASRNVRCSSSRSARPPQSMPRSDGISASRARLSGGTSGPTLTPLTCCSMRRRTTSGVSAASIATTPGTGSS